MNPGRFTFGTVLSLILAAVSFAQGPMGAGTKSVRQQAVAAIEVTQETVSSSTAAAQVVLAQHKKKPFLIRFAIAGATCGVGIGLSANPATAAEIGLPILIGGNYLAWRIEVKHPKLGKLVQMASPLGCFSYGHHAAHVKKVSKPTNPPAGGGGNPPTPPTPPTPPSGGGPGGGNPGGGPGSGGNPGGGPGSGGGPGGHGGGPCIQDCGLPGNGGVNGGHDIKKPPFPGRGRH